MRIQVEQWMTFHAALLLFGTLALFAAATLSYFYLLGIVGFAGLFFKKYQQEQNFRFLYQAANLVTSLRLLGLLFIGACFQQLPPLSIGLLAILILILDGLDGYLARRQNTSSVFGEYLDMETDAFYVLCLSIVLYEMAYLDGWILSIGLLRYAYFLLLRKVKSPQQGEARAFRARLIAVVLMASMAACFILPVIIHLPAMIIATGLVIYSFGESFWLAVRST